MREFTQRLAGEDLTRGLQPRSLGFGSTYMVELLNYRPEVEGLRGYQFLDDPFDGGLTSSFPFPQLLEATDSLYLFEETEVSEVTESVPWSLSAQTTYDSRDSTNATEKSVPAGGRWDFAQTQNSWFAVNGSGVVWKAGRGEMPGDSVAIQVDDLLQPLAAAYQKGRYFMGGFTGSFWSGKIEDIINYWSYDVYVADASDFDVGDHWIAWSSIGGGDFPIWFLGLPRNYPRNQPGNTDRLAEAFKQNEIGMMPLNVEGRVLGLEPLGDNLVAYCDEGIFLIELAFPASEDVPATVGQRKLRDIGVMTRGAFGGNEFQQIYIDQIGRLHRINAEGQIEELGYKNQFSTLTDEDCLIHYDSTGNDFYISFETEAYLLTSQGLCEIGESPTFLTHRGNKKRGVAKDHGKTKGRLVGAPNDFGDRGRKTVTSVGVGLRGTNSDVHAAWQYSPDQDSSLQQTDFQDLNPNGIAYVRATGEYFRPVIEVTDPAKVDIDYIEFRVQYSDKRHQRGPRVGQIDS